MVLPPRGYVAMSGDFWGCHNSVGKRCYWHLVGGDLEMLLNILPRPGQPPTRNYVIQTVTVLRWGNLSLNEKEEKNAATVALASKVITGLNKQVPW